MTLLSVDQINASYGPAQALFGVDLNLSEGEVLALMGRNGMGKSTTIRAIMGMMPATSGNIHFANHDLTRLPSHKVAQLGIGLVPEGRRCFGNLTVRENLTAVARPGHWTPDTLAGLFPRLEERKDQEAGVLSGGEQQMLAIARALITNPRLLILDEATEGLAPLIRQEIWSAINHLKSNTGLAILVVDKSLTELRQIADNAVILERGKTVWSGPMPDLSPAIADQFLGL